ncbi:kinase-like domain, phloem protein 2-like protein [Tanacetum coccineum]|uniref:Kinase-like domain, phloem protein 2-like protein n=1 Tax=Tanacetum coccineum TaxID=301880 RepID=A0ABQ5DXT2_9ASTR
MPQNHDSSILSKQADKGKAIATEEDPTKTLIPFLEESGSSLKILDLNLFSSDGGQMTIEKAKAQMEELRRIELLKAEKEKSERELLKMLNPTTIKAQTLKLAEYEAKRSKMIREYNDCITKRLDPLPITKISKSTKDATMRITRDNDPTTLTVYEKFGLKMLGLTEWIEVHTLASKGKSKSNDYLLKSLLKSLKAKFQWVLTQSGRLGLPPPSELSAYRLNPAEKKRKRDSDLIEEMLVKEDIRIAGMERNLTLPSGVVAIKGKVITEPESEGQQMFKKMLFAIEARDDVDEARKTIKDNIDDGLIPADCKASEGNEDPLSAKHQRLIKGLADGKASTSRLKYIQVKDIVKKVEDYLKTYSPAEMDIRWLIRKKCLSLYKAMQVVSLTKDKSFKYAPSITCLKKNSNIMLTWSFILGYQYWTKKKLVKKLKKAMDGRRIRVKDIVKEVEDYLKTYSSAGMYIYWTFNLSITNQDPEPYHLSYHLLVQVLENHKDNLKLSLEDIKSATKGFSQDNIIGQGDFGNVYKGATHSTHGDNIIAAKWLDKKSGQGDAKVLTELVAPKFMAELDILIEYKHLNVIGLVGYCDKEDEKITVYEYLSRGSLDKYLSDDSLTWVTRLKICIDIAIGLEFLHGSVSSPEMVIHRDISSNNILLFDDWKAKITSFGLSLACPTNQNVDYVIDKVTGTIGYRDPLHSETGFLTKESDIFSLGAVLFDILCGKLSSKKLDDEYLYLPYVAKHHYHAGKLDKLVFKGIKEQIVPRSFIIYAEIAYQCIHHMRERRPTAEEVVIQLKKALEFQEDFEKWEPKLPTDYKEIIQMSKCQEIYSTKKKEELYNIFSKGILLQQDKVLLSFDGTERNEMVSATMFSYIGSCPHELKSLPESSYVTFTSSKSNRATIKVLIFSKVGLVSSHVPGTSTINNPFVL